MNDVPAAVLVITTMPPRVETARVVSTQDVHGGVDATVIVTSLSELLREVEAWWRVYWWPENGDPAAAGRPS